MSNHTADYNDPQAVLTDGKLSSAEKLNILKRMEYDARELQVAEEENMAGGAESRLGQIRAAILSLEPESTPETTVIPTKQGGS